MIRVAMGRMRTPAARGSNARTNCRYWVSEEERAEQGEEHHVIAPLAALKRGFAKKREIEHRVLGARAPSSTKAPSSTTAARRTRRRPRRRPAARRRLDDRPHERGQAGDRQHRADQVEAAGRGVARLGDQDGPATSADDARSGR